jgi:hypothetical protein
MKFPRMSVTAVMALALLCCVAVIAPQQLGVIVYKITLVVMAGVAGYCLDFALFPYGRPHRFKDDIARAPDEHWIDLKAFFAAQFRRAIIVAAAMLAVGLGL